MQGKSMDILAAVQEVNKIKETLITVRNSKETKFKVVFKEIYKKFLLGELLKTSNMLSTGFNRESFIRGNP